MGKPHYGFVGTAVRVSMFTNAQANTFASVNSVTMVGPARLGIKAGAFGASVAHGSRHMGSGTTVDEKCHREWPQAQPSPIENDHALLEGRMATGRLSLRPYR